MPSNYLSLCRSLLLLPSILLSNRIFLIGFSLCIRWPKYWNFSFSISLSNEYSGLISFRIDWVDLLAVQGILKSLFQCHSLKASMFQHSAFFGEGNGKPLQYSCLKNLERVKKQRSRDPHLSSLAPSLYASTLWVFWRLGCNGWEQLVMCSEPKKLPHLEISAYIFFLFFPPLTIKSNSSSV